MTAMLIPAKLIGTSSPVQRHEQIPERAAADSQLEPIYVSNSFKSGHPSANSMSDAPSPIVSPMMILSQAQSPDTCGTLPSIIDLMASNCGQREEPTQLTAGDIAFLRALYSTDLRENLSLATGDIQNAMMREFKRH